MYKRQVPTTAAATTAVETTTTTVAAPTTVAATVAPLAIDPAAYIGKPYDQAHDELAALGFDVVQHKTKGKGHGSDTVVDVEPTGVVAPGSTITLTVNGGKDG